MIDVHSIDAIVQRLANAVPPDLALAREDLAENFRDVLAQGLRHLDLVTREEFDVQRQVLARTRQHVEQCERRIAELEARLADSGH